MNRITAISVKDAPLACTTRPSMYCRPSIRYSELKCGSGGVVTISAGLKTNARNGASIENGKSVQEQDYEYPASVWLEQPCRFPVVTGHVQGLFDMNCVPSKM